MKILNKAFTLVELLVVTTIITLLSVWSVFYFLDFVKNQEIIQKVMLIEDNFDDLDKQIKDYKIFDYQLIFNTWSLSNLYVTYINNFDIPYNQDITFSSTTWIWIIETNWLSSQEWKIKLFKKNKLFLFETKAGNDNYSFVFNKENYYKTTWTLSWEILNEIHINYFSEDNIYPEKNNSLILYDINIKEDKSWTQISELEITNIWWVKKFYDEWVEFLSNEVYLFFENNWKEKFIKITK